MDDVDGEEGGVGVEEVSSVFEVGVVKVEGIDEMEIVSVGGKVLGVVGVVGLEVLLPKKNE